MPFAACHLNSLFPNATKKQVTPHPAPSTGGLMKPTASGHPLPTRLCANSFLLSFRGAAGDEESRTALKTLRARFLAEFTLSTQSEIPSRRSGQALRGVYPERQSEILRSAQNDKRRAQDDSEGLGMTRNRVFPQPRRYGPRSKAAVATCIVSIHCFNTSLDRKRRRSAVTSCRVGYGFGRWG